MADRMYAVVTTEYRGVFAGEIDDDAAINGPLKITNARMAVFWSADVKGVMGLAATGPSEDCRISPAAPEVTVRKVTAIFRCSDAARSAWEKAPWRS